jgi:hypothetical protein
MKFIKNFFDFIAEGAYINPENPNEVILTYTNLPERDPQYDNEVLITLVDTREKRGSEYVLDKYFALVLPNENLTSGFSRMKLKKLDHPGRPKATMDLLKAGKIKGGQAAVDEFLQNAIPKIGMNKIDYVCSLDSTGPLVKMMTNFFVSRYGSTQVDLPKAQYSTILDAIVWDNLINELVASEKSTKKTYKNKLDDYLAQNRYIIDLAKRNLPFTLPYTIKDGANKITITQKFEKPDISPTAIIDEIKNKQKSILLKFFAVIEESIDIPGTESKEYKKFNTNKKQAIDKIIGVYFNGNEQTIGDLSAQSVDATAISEQIIKIIESSLDKLAFQPSYKLRTSGTALGSSMRKIFKDKYSYIVNFEDAVIDCIATDKEMLIIDDNIHSGTDFRNIDKKVQEIVTSSKFYKSDSPKQFSNIKMFVLYDMGSAFKMKSGSGNIESLVTRKDIVADFKDSILKTKSRIPEKVVMSYVLFKDKKLPTPSLPTLKLKINEFGEIEDMDIDASKSSLAYSSEYSELVDPSSWNFPFRVGDKIFREDAMFIPQFEAWAKSIGLWINGEKFI